MKKLVLLDILVVVVSVLGTTVGLPDSVYTLVQKDAIVAKHNEFRTAAAGSNMQYMCWNEDLASMAQEWANRCNWRHGQPEVNHSPWRYLGQNAYWHNASSIDPLAAVTSWHNEIVDYTYEDNSCLRECGHYKQIVWATTTHVGCGVQTCTPPEFGDRDKESGTIFVCYYGPRGNLWNIPPYLRGEPCSACSSNETSCEDGLCVENEEQQTCGGRGDGGSGGGQEDVCEGVTCQNGGTPTASGSACECNCTSEWQADDCSENVEQARFGIKAKIRMSLDHWDYAWDRIMRPLAAEGITRICNTNTWYTTCCNASSLEGVSFDPKQDYMTTSGVKLGTGFPKVKSHVVHVLFYAQAQGNSDLCKAGAGGRRNGDAQGFLPPDLILAALELTAIDTELQRCCGTVDALDKAENVIDED